MYRKSKVSAEKDTPEQLELQSLPIEHEVIQDNEYIDSVLGKAMESLREYVGYYC